MSEQSRGEQSRGEQCRAVQRRRCHEEETEKAGEEAEAHRYGYAA